MATNGRLSTASRHTARAIIATLCFSVGSTTHAGELISAYRQALAEDPTLASAEASADLERERWPQALSFVLPQLEAGASWRRSRQDTLKGVPGIIREEVTISNTTGYDLRLTQPLFNLAAFAGLNTARKTVAAAELDYQAAQSDLMIRCIRAYLNVLSTQNERQLADREFEAVERQTQRTKRRYEVGSAALADLQEAQARLDLTEAGRIEAQRQLVSARESFREITGRLPKNLPGLGKDYVAELPQPAQADDWVAQAVQSNPQIIAAQLRQAAAEHEITANRAGHLPSINLTGAHQYEDNSDAPFGTEQERSSISVGLSLPIYSGGSVSSSTRQARANLRVLSAESRRAKRSIERQTRDAFNVVALEKQRISALSNAVASSATAEKAARRGQELGARSIVDVLNAQRDLFSAQRDLIRARHNHLLASAELRQLTGSIDETFMTAMDELLVDQSGLGAINAPTEAPAKSKAATAKRPSQQPSEPTKQPESSKSNNPATSDTNASKGSTAAKSPQAKIQVEPTKSLSVPPSAPVSATNDVGSDKDMAPPKPSLIMLKKTQAETAVDQ